MEFQIRSIFNLLILFSFLLSLSMADERTGSFLFIDSNTHQFLRSRSTNDIVQMTPVEAGAAVSVLLGFSPPVTLSASSSAKLNDVLMPNPFDRPGAVFMLEVTGVNDLVASDNAFFRDVIKRKIIPDSENAQMELPGEDVSVVSLNDKLESFTDKELSALASWLGGLYTVSDLATMNGEMIIPLANGANMKFYISKEADREFIASLLTLFHNSRRAIEMHEDLSQAAQGPAELIMGRFDGIKALQEQYGHEVVNQGMELLQSTVSKILESLQAAYKGQIVGVITCNEISVPETEKMFNVVLTSRPSARWLEETEGSTAANATHIAEIALVRTTLAWLTGIILIIATLLGVYMLFNMPLTRDTLLYSNVKLD